MKKTILKTLYNFGAFTPFHRINRDEILILMYHRFSRETNPYKISGDEFAAHLEYLSKHNRVLSLSETINYLQNGKSLPPNTTVITIDDGYADAYEIAFPILKKFNFPATVYAVTGFLDGKRWLWTDLMRFVLLQTKFNSINIEFKNEKINCALTSENRRLETASRINSRLKKMPDQEKETKIKEIAESLKVEIPEKPTSEYAPMSWEQAAKTDAENVRIESHTVTHPILTNVSQSRMDFELQNSKRRLEEVLNRKVENFCYPNGSLNKNARTAVENAGYKCAVTTEFGFNQKSANLFLLKRIDAPPGIAEFAQSVSGFELIKQKLRS